MHECVVLPLAPLQHESAPRTQRKLNLLATRTHLEWKQQRKRIGVIERSLFAFRNPRSVLTPLVRKTECINHPHFVRDHPHPTTY